MSNNSISRLSSDSSSESDGEEPAPRVHRTPIPSGHRDDPEDLQTSHSRSGPTQTTTTSTESPSNGEGNSEANPKRGRPSSKMPPADPEGTSLASPGEEIERPDEHDTPRLINVVEDTRPSTQLEVDRSILGRVNHQFHRTTEQMINGLPCAEDDLNILPMIRRFLWIKGEVEEGRSIPTASPSPRNFSASLSMSEMRAQLQLAEEFWAEDEDARTEAQQMAWIWLS